MSKIAFLKEMKRKYGVHFYKLLPAMTMDVYAATKICLERLHLYMDLDRTGTLLYFADENVKFLESAKNKPYYYLLDTEWSNDKLEWDNLSHHMLRLAFYEDHRRYWFVRRELELFLYRFSKLSNEEVDQYVDAINCCRLNVVSIDDAELLTNIFDAYGMDLKPDIDYGKFYKVPYKIMALLLGRGKVYLRNGHAYIMDEHRKYVLAHKFEELLTRKLESLITNKFVIGEKMKEIIESITFVYDTKLRLRNEKMVRESDLDELSEWAYPPCMRHIHLHFRKNHHMNYYMRVQYGVFLKSIGLPIRETIKFWKEEFTQIMSEKEFNQKYLYAIHHIYGLVGNQINYECPPCTTVINKHSYKNGNVNCGCMFAHRDLPAINSFLSDQSLYPDEIGDIEDCVADKCYTKACAMFFNYKHSTEHLRLVQSPKQFYLQSIECRT